MFKESSRLFDPQSERFLYVYDFGDNWEHEIVVEKVIAGDARSEQPLCLAGRLRRAPEDCGGPTGYQQFLEAIGDPAHEDHRAMLDWVGGSFDAEALDLALVNRVLTALPVGRPRVE